VVPVVNDEEWSALFEEALHAFRTDADFAVEMAADAWTYRLKGRDYVRRPGNGNKRHDPALLGRVFGDWTVIEIDAKNSNTGENEVWLRCTEGHLKATSPKELKATRCRSCSTLVPR
jgi:hypothetical protein